MAPTVVFKSTIVATQGSAFQFATAPTPPTACHSVTCVHQAPHPPPEAPRQQTPSSLRKNRGDSEGKGSFGGGRARVLAGNAPGSALIVLQGRRKPTPPRSSGPSGLDPRCVQMPEEVGQLQRGLCWRSRIPRWERARMREGPVPAQPPVRAHAAHPPSRYLLFMSVRLCSRSCGHSPGRTWGACTGQSPSPPHPPHQVLMCFQTRCFPS